MDFLQQVADWAFAPAFSLLGSAVTWTELLAFGLSLWMVVCNIRVQVLGWPLAIISSALYGLLFVQYRLYGEAGLQLLFMALAGWGWWQWRCGRRADGQHLTVQALAPVWRWRVLLLILLAWPLLAWVLDHATDSDVPWLDALPTVGSIAGQVLLGRKFVENWPVWIAVNLLSIGLFVFKALWLTALLYAVFALLAWQGWRAWQTLRQNPATA